MNFRTPALAAAGLVLAEIGGRLASAKLSPPSSTIGSLLVPGITFAAGHYVHGRGGIGSSIGNGMMASALLHAAARFSSNLDLDLRTY